MFFCRSTSWDQQSSYDYREIWICTQVESSIRVYVTEVLTHCEQAFELIGWSRASSQNDWHGPLALELNVWAWNSQHRSIRALWAHSHPLAYSWSDELTCTGMCLHVLYPPLYLWSSPQKLSHWIIYYGQLCFTLIVMFLFAAQVWAVYGLQINFMLFKPIVVVVVVPLKKKCQ